MNFIVVQPTGFVPYFAYSWDGRHVHWVTRRDLAKRFTRFEAQTIIKQLNANSPINPARFEEVR